MNQVLGRMNIEKAKDFTQRLLAVIGTQEQPAMMCYHHPTCEMGDVVSEPMQDEVQQLMKDYNIA